MGKPGREKNKDREKQREIENKKDPSMCLVALEHITFEYREKCG